ncbi:RluA family pseudouridine synthase [Maribacter sp. 2308TA10-17]|uniref:RluA family pseudouridine synthase n=1 Tax=Maribacter sp. 2308TA10-17 TaxID=3386276 RepID=UPI0039BD5F22
MKTKTETHIAAAQEKPIRLQEYGVGIFPTLSTKSALKKAIKKEYILVNGKLGTTSTFIHGNEIIAFIHPENDPCKKQLILKLEVVYEDDYLAIMNKPPGILVSGNSFKTIANALEQNLKKSDQADAVKPQPTHRLDYATTGLLLIGKTSASILALNRLFEQKKVLKTYFAVTIGKMKKEGTIDIPIDDKKAFSKFEIVNTVVSERFQYLNLVKLTPKTGRRHQLRKHLAFLGNPILGDSTYGKEGLILKGKGLYLHAFSLGFVHPFTKENLRFEKELPAKYRKLFS